MKLSEIGAALDGIYLKRGALDAQAVVDESKPRGAPLHACFEWDDKKAGNQYRVGQARRLIRRVPIERGKSRKVAPKYLPITTSEMELDGGYRPTTERQSHGDRVAAVAFEWRQVLSLVSRARSICEELDVDPEGAADLESRVESMISRLTCADAA